jgi:hypothetical protein
MIRVRSAAGLPIGSVQPEAVPKGFKDRPKWALNNIRNACAANKNAGNLAVHRRFR